jgi:hypothetical protein
MIFGRDNLRRVAGDDIEAQPQPFRGGKRRQIGDGSAIASMRICC